MIGVSALTKRYGETLALDDVSLTLAPGELRGLLGPNGAGKTTLLRILFGLVPADAGSVEVPREGVAGFVEEPAFYPYLSGRANLELLVELDDGHGAGIDEALARVGLQDRAGDRVAGYSTGMRQRLGIAAALVRDARVLLLDEPTSGLDPAGARAVGGLLRELAGHGVAVLVSSHLIGELEGLCDSYTVIRAGRVVWDGRAERVEQDAPAAAYRLATTDDALALALAAERPRVEAAPAGEGRGLRLEADREALAGFVLALGRADVAVLRLEQVASPLESLFFALTGP